MSTAQTKAQPGTGIGGRAQRPPRRRQRPQPAQFVAHDPSLQFGQRLALGGHRQKPGRSAVGGCRPCARPLWSRWTRRQSRGPGGWPCRGPSVGMHRRQALPRPVNRLRARPHPRQSTVQVSRPRSSDCSAAASDGFEARAACDLGARRVVVGGPADVAEDAQHGVLEVLIGEPGQREGVGRVVGVRVVHHDLVRRARRRSWPRRGRTPIAPRSTRRWRRRRSAHRGGR